MEWGALLSLFNKLLSYFESFLFTKRQKEIEDVIRDAKDDPTGAFNKHFNRLPGASKANPQTDKANDPSA